jgi:hypothetical protein
VRGVTKQLAVALAVGVGLTVAAVWRAGDARERSTATSTSTSTSTSTATSTATSTPTPTATATSAAPPAAPDESTLMFRLRAARSTPALAIELAREGDRRFPDSPDAAERASILIHALADEGRAVEARGAAESVVNRYPDSSWVREIEQFTGAHRHRNIRTTADGALEYYDP